MIGTLTIPELGPGESTILEFEWQVPNPYIFDNWSTCLLARIEGSVEDPITVYPGQAELDVYHNNNIALRNTTVVDIVPGMQPTVIDGVKYPPGVFTYVGNAGPTNLVSDLRFDAVQAGLGRTVVDEAEVHVVFDTEGWAKVSPQLGQATGVKQINEGELVLTSAHAVIPDVLWTARTTFPVYVGYNFLCEEVTEPRTYVLHMSQNITGDPEHLLGAEHFTVRWSPRQLFIADGGQNMELRGEPTATLTASSIAEDVTSVPPNHIGVILPRFIHRVWRTDPVGFAIRSAAREATSRPCNAVAASGPRWQRESCGSRLRRWCTGTAG